MLCLFLARWHWGYDPISYASFISQTVKVDLGMLTPGKWATVASPICLLSVGLGRYLPTAEAACKQGR